MTIRAGMLCRALAAGCAALGAGLLPGCTAPPMTWSDVSPTIEVRVVNGTDMPATLTLLVADRAASGPARVAREGRPQIIRPRGITDISVASARSLLNNRDPGKQHALWLRVEPSGASWRDNPVFYYELVGPPPSSLSLLDRSTKDRTVIQVAGTGITAEAVPATLWPASETRLSAAPSD
jgi:hypothetical protein